MNLMEINNLEKRIRELEKRVANLEKKSIESNVRDIPQRKGVENSSKYKGLTGGINFLIDDNFFKLLRTSREIHEELKKEGYVYRVEAVDTILRRDFVARKKILNRIPEENIWKYGLRK